MFKHTLPDSSRFPRGHPISHWKSAAVCNNGATLTKAQPKTRLWPTVASRDDFEFALGTQRQITPEEVHQLLLQPTTSLYAVDCIRHTLTFTVCLPEHTEQVYSAPFLYQGQRERAVQILEVSAAVLEQVTQDLLLLQKKNSNSVRDTTNKDKHKSQISFISGVPRSGTTLLCKIVQAAGTYFAKKTTDIGGDDKFPNRQIVAVSEPDVLTELVRVRSPDGCNDALLVDYLALMLPYLCRGLCGEKVVSFFDGTPNRATTTATTFVIKPRSEVNHLIDLINKAHGRVMDNTADNKTANTQHSIPPHIVSFRQCRSVAQSMAKIAEEDIRTSLSVPLDSKQIRRDLIRQIPQLENLHSPSDVGTTTVVSGLEIVVCMWCSCVASCQKCLQLSQKESDNNITNNVAVQYYERWSKDCSTYIPIILQQLDCLPPSFDNQTDLDGLVQACKQAMEQDSQAGTRMSGLNKTLKHWSDEYNQEISATLQKLGFEHAVGLP